MSVIKARAPVTGGNFGVWGGMFSTFDCAVKGVRQKEDMWNPLISGFMTGGCLAARSESLLVVFGAGSICELIQLPGGPRSALGSATICAVVRGVFEGAEFLRTRASNDNLRPKLPSSAFGSLFIL